MSSGQAKEITEDSESSIPTSQQRRNKRPRLCRSSNSNTSAEVEVGELEELKDSGDMADMVDDKDDDMKYGEEFMSNFVDRIDVCWNDIVDRITQSQFWKSQEEAMNRMDTDLNELKEENAALRKRLLFSEGRLTRVEKELDKAKEKIIDLTSRSMRDNLIFKNAEETRGEDVEEKIRKILKDKLQIQNSESLEIQRAHRTGKPGAGYTRNIVARFSSKSKGVVMRHLKNLRRDDAIKISEQYPPEVNLHRSKLWPQFIEAKENHKDTRFNVDTLIIENKVVKPPKDKIMDINMDATSRAMSLKPKHTPVNSSSNSHFQGHIIPVESIDDVIPAVQALCSEPRVAGAAHLIYAYKIGNEESYLSNYEDDGEWGGGREVMKVLDEKRCFNHVVAVTRWHSGRVLGPSRFKLIKEMAEKAVAKVIQ